MAGKVRHLLLRDGRYYARRIVPKELREFIQKNEVRIPLGSDRRAAIEQLPYALVKIGSLINHARDALQTRAANAEAILVFISAMHTHARRFWIRHCNN